MNVLNKVIDRCVLGLAALAGALVLLLLLAVCFATLSRYLFNEPYAYLIDYAAYSLLYIAFLGTPWLYKNRGHVSIEMVVDRLPEKSRHIWDGVLDIVVFFVAVLMCWIGFRLTMTNIVSNIRISDFLGTPKWLLLAPIPLSMFFLAIQAIRNAAESFTKKVNTEGGAN